MYYLGQFGLDLLVINDYVYLSTETPSCLSRPRGKSDAKHSESGMKKVRQNVRVVVREVSSGVASSVIISYVATESSMTLTIFQWSASNISNISAYPCSGHNVYLQDSLDVFMRARKFAVVKDDSRTIPLTWCENYSYRYTDATPQFIGQRVYRAPLPKGKMSQQQQFPPHQDPYKQQQQYNQQQQYGQQQQQYTQQQQPPYTQHQQQQHPPQFSPPQQFNAVPTPKIHTDTFQFYQTDFSAVSPPANAATGTHPMMYNGAAAAAPMYQVPVEVSFLAAFGTGGLPGEPPLLEELGINVGHIYQKTITVLNPMKTIDQRVMEDADLWGPFLFCLAFGAFLLLSGKVHFSYIYGVAMLGWVSIYAILNMMSEGGADIYRTASVLGYCLLPMVILSSFSILLRLRGAIGLALGFTSILWCTYASSAIFVTILDMKNQRILVAYPVGLLYACFALITIF